MMGSSCPLCGTSLPTERSRIDHRGSKLHRQREGLFAMGRDGQLAHFKSVLRRAIAGMLLPSDDGLNCPDARGEGVPPVPRGLSHLIDSVAESQLVVELLGGNGHQRRQSAQKEGRVVLFYRYCDLTDPEAERSRQLALCRALELRGRVRIAPEGINGTLGGSKKSIDLYCGVMRRHQLFAPLDLKLSPGSAADFPNLWIKVCTEIIALGIDPAEVSYKDAGPHLEPKEWHEILLRSTAHNSKNKNEEEEGQEQEQEQEQEQRHRQQKGCDSPPPPPTPPTPPTPPPRSSSSSAPPLLVDCRNEYESKVGRFVGSTALPTRHFKETPEALDELVRAEGLRNDPQRPVLMYCTGGIRCERASAYLRRKHGLRNVKQLHGGIHRYMEAYPNPAESQFEGHNFVFDRRLVAPPQQRQQQQVEEKRQEVEEGKKQGAEQKSNRPGSRPVQPRCVGRCDTCGSKPWDSYDLLYVCMGCRVLLLVCDECRGCVEFTRAEPRRAVLHCRRCETQQEKNQNTISQEEEEPRDQGLGRQPKEQLEAGAASRRRTSVAYRRHYSVICGSAAALVLAAAWVSYNGRRSL